MNPKVVFSLSCSKILVVFYFSGHLFHPSFHLSFAKEKAEGKKIGRKRVVF